LLYLFGSGHLIPASDDEAIVLDSVEATLEQCRAQNRQLISEMRELLLLLILVLVRKCCDLDTFDLVKVFKMFAVSFS